MAAHADFLDQPEHLAKPFWGSLILHISVGGLLLFYSLVGPGLRRPFMGDPNGGGIGSVAVGVTATIPLPPKSGPTNPVANDTESAVPAPPPKAKPKPQVRTPDPDAIPIKSRSARKRAMESAAASESNKFREQQKDVPNQLYTSGGQSVSSPMYNMPGGGGVGIGNNSPFGTQFGWYATLLQNQIGQHWRTADINARITAGAVVVSFTLRRDGSLAPGSLRITQPSGNQALDLSAQRAIYDAVPFPNLPQGFPRSDAQIEFRFELRR